MSSSTIRVNSSPTGAPINSDYTTSAVARKVPRVFELAGSPKTVRETNNYKGILAMFDKHTEVTAAMVVLVAMAVMYLMPMMAVMPVMAVTMEEDTMVVEEVEVAVIWEEVAVVAVVVLDARLRWATEVFSY
ncbi:MAG: hypothetical protein TREMPRED_006017 [Tremellales sp. Tagirdzhanova-0007]|nr:MAG: hypothetical protein TREMPRED_006017 [Tremellales sp. Tagirdzhanova-0007]